MAGISFAEHTLMDFHSTSAGTAAGIPASVDSFSQLPFIRSGVMVNDTATIITTTTNNNSNNSNCESGKKEKAIRLFGIEFGEKRTSHGSSREEEDSDETVCEEITKELEDGNSSTNNNVNLINANNKINNNGGGFSGNVSSSSSNSRKFECHYCCRNFPTSQALGGHQNAHKRERQHAKRVHLQSVMAQPVTVGSSLGPVYGFMNYHHHHHHHKQQFPAMNRVVFGRLEPPSYPWLSNPTQTINGSPLQPIWSVPLVQHSQAHEGLQHPYPPLQLLAGDGSSPRHEPVQGHRHQAASTPPAKDTLSLDLHL